MNNQPMQQKIHKIQTGLELVLKNANDILLQPELLSVFLEEIGITLEELEVQQQELLETRWQVEFERQRYQSLFNSAPDAYLVTNTKGIIQKANLAAANLFNVNRTFLVGKPIIVFVAQEDRRRVTTQLNQLTVFPVRDWEVRLQPRECEPLTGSIAICTILDAEGKGVELFWTIRDISRRKQAEAALEGQLNLDGLTQVSNRRHFEQVLEKEWQRSRRDQLPLAIIFIDVDSFKRYNDSYGHQKGDQCLQEIAKAIRDVVKRPADLVARYGGDEFAVLLPNTDSSGATEVAHLIQQALQGIKIINYRYENHSDNHSAPIREQLTLSLGIASQIPKLDQKPGMLIAGADRALYQVKALGGNSYAVCNNQGQGDTLCLGTLEEGLERELYRAVGQNEFILHYQPIMSLETRQILGFEVLVRWQHPKQGLMRASEFISIAEQTGLILPLGEWVLSTACWQLHEWQYLPNTIPLFISVNLSAQQLCHPSFLPQLEQILQETGISGSNLILEITENSLLAAKADGGIDLNQLQALGIQLALDNFGSSYCCLAHLTNLPINIFKIDPFFIQTMESESKNEAMVKSIIFLAHQLGITLTAKAIENPQQMASLQELNCDYGQGFFLSDPMDAKGAFSLIQSGN
ncbi:MAG: EAL domain-containing protein [Moorea sp. SIO3G5]|nr:EAL domain-containing protein [Moorena sp. SIO3G5]